MKWTEERVVDVLRRVYEIGDGTTGSEWSLLTQVAVGGRRLDALLHQRSTGHLVALEIKCSRADFRNESNDKRAPAEAVAHLCYYVTPPGLLRDYVLPSRWGLIEVDEPDVEDVRVPPGSFNADPDAVALLPSALARASDDAEAIRRAATPGADLVALQRRVSDLLGQVENARAAGRREHARAVEARSNLLGAEGMQECATCHEAVTWSATGALSLRWRHVTEAAERKCHRERAAAAKAAAEARTGARYLSVAPGPVLPVALAD